MTPSMECHCLRFSELPHTTKLFATFTDEFQRVAPYYSHPPVLEGVEAAARETRLDAGVRRSVVEVLREQNRRLGAGAATTRNLDRLEAGAVAVVTGQQVGLFSGPSYSFYKALTAVRWAKELTERGIDAVPVFWLATEDHDLAEVNHSFWNGANGLARLEVPSSEEVTGRRVGEVELGDAVAPIIETAVAQLAGPNAGEVAQALRESYSPKESFGSAFGKLMVRLLGGRGIILLDPLDGRLHRLAAGVYRRAIEHGDALNRDLIVRSKALERAGFHAQVKVTRENSLLFLNVEGRRQPLRRRNNGFVVGRQAYNVAELLGAVEKSPELFTPNVLLRPVLQDALLPTVAYVGGPAEVAYFAQAEVVYRRLLGRMPAVLPRAGFTLVEPSVARLLARYELETRDVFGGRQRLRARMTQQFLPKALSKRFADDERTLRRLFQGLRRPIGKLDKTLLGALVTTERKVLYQFLKLRGKAGRAENLRTGLLDRHERLLLDSLYPHHGLQERSLCFLPFLAAHGPGLLDEIEKRAGNSTQHQVLFL